MPDTGKVTAAVFARTASGQTLYAREATIEVSGPSSIEITPQDRPATVESAVGALPIDHLRAIADSARHAITLTQAHNTTDATEHVHAIERLITAYHIAARTQEA